jgi:hypothetical protein
MTGNRRGLRRCGQAQCCSTWLLIIHDVRDSFRHVGRCGNCCLDPELQLGFGSSIKLLVDGRIIAVKGHVRASRVGETFESDFCIRGQGEEKSKL